MRQELSTERETGSALLQEKEQLLSLLRDKEQM
jgi:hypothetical protein